MTRALISYPKSGRTWLRVMLDSLAIRVAYTHGGLEHLVGRHWELLNTEASTQFDTIVLILRDPRDTAVSGFHHASKRRKTYTGTLSEYVRDPGRGVRKIIQFHLLWSRLTQQRPGMLVVSYEQLHADTAGTLGAICRFLGADVSADHLAETVRQNDFQSMQERERTGAYIPIYGRILAPSDVNDVNSYKVRKGRIGSYLEELSAADIAFCNDQLRETRYLEAMAIHPAYQQLFHID